MAFMCLYPGKKFYLRHFRPFPYLYMLLKHYFIARLGLKGPVYLKDKDGKACVPISLISGKSSDGKHNVQPCFYLISILNLHFIK